LLLFEKYAPYLWFSRYRVEPLPHIQVRPDVGFQKDY